MKQNFFRVILILSLCLSINGNAQIKKENFRLGFNYGSGSQNRFPFDLKDYSHEVSFYKIQVNYLLKDKIKWTFEFNLEPTYYVAKHQLLNKWLIKESVGENYQELRDFHTQKREIKEYVLNLGLLARYKISNKLSVYSIGSVGPMISDEATERLAKGFAFSDILGFGASYRISDFIVDFRYSVRHTSNLKMKDPNHGHNTTNIEFGVLIDLYK